MSACERCWEDAYLRMMALGGTQAEHYEHLRTIRDSDPEQRAKCAAHIGSTHAESAE